MIDTHKTAEEIEQDDLERSPSMAEQIVVAVIAFLIALAVVALVM